MCVGTGICRYGITLISFITVAPFWVKYSTICGSTESYFVIIVLDVSMAFSSS